MPTEQGIGLGFRAPRTRPALKRLRWRKGAEEKGLKLGSNRVLGCTCNTFFGGTPTKKSISTSSYSSPKSL